MRYPYTIFILTHRQQQQHCTADSFSSKFTSIKKYELALFTPEFTVGRNQPDIYRCPEDQHQRQMSTGVAVPLVRSFFATLIVTKSD